MQRLIAVLFLSCSLAQAQAERPAYEVAVIKPNNSGEGNSGWNSSPGQIVFTDLSLKHLIETAYDVKPFQVVAPDWTNALHFDISANYPPGVKDDDRLPMLRTLLEDRFNLAVHKESKEVQDYELVVAKKGFKLEPVEPGGSNTHSGGDHTQKLTAQRVSMQGLSDYVARRLEKTVVDKTGITGVYDFTLRWSKEDQPADNTDPDPAPSLFTALEDTLGLQLQAQKVSMTIFVVDHVEHTPEEN